MHYIKLKEDIIRESEKRNINPYVMSFKPKDLGLKASDYGSFSDYCSESETASGRHNNNVVLKAVEFSTFGKPLRYVLLK